MTGLIIFNHNLSGITIPKNTIIFTDALLNSCAERITVSNSRNYYPFFEILYGANYLFYLGCTDLIILDGDIKLKPHFADTLLSFLKTFPDTIISGFNTLKHPVTATYADYCTKKTIDGTSMTMKEPVFRKFLEPALKRGYGWEKSMCRLMSIHDKEFVVCSPSVVQFNNEAFDFNGN